MPQRQCSGSRSGSESGSGSTCFWASRIRIHLSEIWIRIRIPLSSCKNSKKNLDSYYCATLFDFLSLENYVNVPLNSNMQKKMFKQKLFFIGILKVNDEKSRIRIQDPDPLVRDMDPRIRIRIHSKMSWIRNTAQR